MTNADKLKKSLEQDGIELYELPLKSKTRGLYGDGVIAISDKLDTDAEIACILAEELGHYNTSYGDILDQKNEIARKQELRARGWAYNEMILIHEVIEAFNCGCRSWFELADHIGVTEEFLKDAVEYYKNKYGIYKVVGDYILYFEPFGILKMFQE